MIPIYRAAVDVQQLCIERAWPYCFIGGLVLPRWGQARYTRDADLTVFTGFGSEEDFVDVLLARFDARGSDAREFALHARVLLLQHSNGVPVDVALGALPFEAHAVERSSLWHAAEGVDLRTCCDEALIVHKTFAGRPHDWGDAESIIRRQRSNLDLDLIFSELEPLLALKEQPELVEQLRALFRKHGVPAS